MGSFDYAPLRLAALRMTEFERMVETCRYARASAGVSLEGIQ